MFSQKSSSIFFVATEQTLDIHPMLFQCWPTGLHANPTLKQHWLNAACLLGRPVRGLQKIYAMWRQQCLAHACSASHWGSPAQKSAHHAQKCLRIEFCIIIERLIRLENKFVRKCQRGSLGKPGVRPGRQIIRECKLIRSPHSWHLAAAR